MTVAEPPRQPAAARRPERDERSLLQALARGDTAAGAELVERTYRKVWGALYRASGGDAELAADLTQEVYRKAWAALGGFDGRSQLSTWLHRIAITTYLNHVRRPRRVVPLEEGVAAAASDPGEDQETAAIRGQRAERLRRGVLELPEPFRSTVAARFWGEVPVRELAASEGVSEPAIRKRLAKAYRLLMATVEVTS